MASYQPLLDFWLGADTEVWPPAQVSKRWFNSTQQDDAQMAERFGALVDAALAGGLQEWEQSAASRLALILLLDQLPRNIFRGSARAFAGDARACVLSAAGVRQKLERSLPWAAQVFFYMPLMHAEIYQFQALCVRSLVGLQKRVPASLKASIGGNIKFAREHESIIQRFGRFPHRNQVLGRDSSAAELAFLEHANRYGQ